MNMEKRVLEYILENKLLQEKEKVVVGVSGGPDSICLLEVLYRLQKQLEIELVVAHINHMLRGEEANKDEKYVNDFCVERGIEVYSKRININEFAKKQRMSTETAGREARYQFFREVMEKTNSNKIATAHNANDQVETIFMRIMRGTGLEGLTGIPVKRESIYIRPILFLQREEIEWYCEKNNLNPRIDRSNMERDYSRNKIRLDIIPYMKENFNPDVVTVINRMADTLKEDNELIESVIDEYFFKYCKVEKDYIVIRSDIAVCKSVIINRVIRKATSIISGSGYNIEAKHIVSIKKLLKLGTNKRVDLPNSLYAENVYGDIYVRKVESEEGKYCEEVVINKDHIESEFSFGEYSIKFEVLENVKNIKFTDNSFIKYFNYDKINGNIIIRTRKNGDKMIPLGMNGRKKIKDIFIDSKVSVSQRDIVPIIQFDDEVAWLVGLKVSNEYKVTKDTKKLLKITVMERN